MERASARGMVPSGSFLIAIMANSASPMPMTLPQRLRIIPSERSCLTPMGRSAGLVGDERWEVFTRKQGQRERLLAALASHPNGQWLKRTEASIAEIGPWIEEVLSEKAARGLLTTIETEIKYGGYIRQQERQMERMKDAERRTIPTQIYF